MPTWIKLLALSLCFLPSAHAAKNDTADNWKCEHRVGGSWKFGRAPSACDVKPFADPQTVIDQFSPIIFDDSNDESAERNRYMNDLYAVVRDLGEYYIKQRKPSVSNAEIQAWQQAVYAKTH